MIRDIGVRLMTAIGFTAWVLVSLYYSNWTYYLFFCTVAFACSYEYLRITYKNSKKAIWLTGSIALAGICGLFVAFSEKGISGNIVIIIAIISLITAIYFGTQLNAAGKQPFGIKIPFLSAFGYIGLPCILAILLARYSAGYPGLPLLGAIPLIWANDTGAYLVGSWIGKTAFYPEISPKKSVEGTIGGILSSRLSAFPISYMNSYFTLKQWLMVAMLVGLTAITGDLLESKFKRYYGVKDTGNFLPGHGGFLDRFDSFLFLMPFLATFIIILKSSN